MTVTAAETAVTPVLAQGDKVRIGLEAQSNQGGLVTTSLRGQIGTLDFYDSYDGWFVRPANGTGFADYVASRYLVKITEADELRDEIAALKVKLGEAVAEGNRKLQSFQDKVQQAIVAAADEDGDMTGTANDILEPLGLEPLTREFEVTVTFKGSYTTLVNAVSEDDATEQIDKSEVVDYIENGNVSYLIDDYGVDLS